jgi:hypothetical protein
MGEATTVLRVDSKGAVTREPALERLVWSRCALLTPALLNRTNDAY